MATNETLSVTMLDVLIPPSMPGRRMLARLIDGEEEYEGRTKQTARSLVARGLAEPVVVVRLTPIGRQVADRVVQLDELERRPWEAPDA